MPSSAVIAGFPRVGLNLTVTPTLEPGDAVNGCRWFYATSPSGTYTALGPETPTLSPYSIVPADELVYIRAKIKFTSSPTIDTLPVGPITSNLSYVTTSVAVVPGTGLVAGSFSADGDKAQAYDWFRATPDAPDAWTKINGATNARYIVQAGDVGYLIRPAVKFKEAGTIHATAAFGPVTRA